MNREQSKADMVMGTGDRVRIGFYSLGSLPAVSHGHETDEQIEV